jgi:hypothetical protein
VTQDARELTVLARLFEIDPLVFRQALASEAGANSTPQSDERIRRLYEAALELGHVIPEEAFSVWAHSPLPRRTESPADILNGNRGFDGFLGLIEGIVHGDFS